MTPTLLIHAISGDSIYYIFLLTHGYSKDPGGISVISFNDVGRALTESSSSIDPGTVARHGAYKRGIRLAEHMPQK
jgi:hypothetical protein